MLEAFEWVVSWADAGEFPVFFLGVIKFFGGDFWVVSEVVVGVVFGDSGHGAAIVFITEDFEKSLVAGFGPGILGEAFMGGVCFLVVADPCAGLDVFEALREGDG